MRRVKTAIMMGLAALAITATAAAQAGSTGKDALIDPNKATESELAAIPHIAPAIAKEIAAKRPFKTISDLDALLKQHKLTPEQLKEVYGRMFVPIDLNTATDEQILMIPGIGKRMLHEFKEYRPYKSMAQFRREIGKYVSKEEVARFERYVTIQ